MTWLEKRIISALGIVMALLSVVLLVVLGLRYQDSRDRQEEETVLTAAAEAEAEVTVLNTSPYSALTYSDGSVTLSFSVNDAGEWVWSDDTSFPLDTTVLAKILDELTSWDPKATVTDPTLVAASGISRPLATLTATLAETGAIRLTFAGQTEDGDRYVAVNDNLDVLYVIEDVLYPLLCVPIYDMCQLPQLPLLSEEALHIVMIQGSPDEAGGGVATVLLSQRDTLSEKVIWRARGGDVTENPDVKMLISDLTALQLKQCFIYRPSAEAVKLCGFDTPARLTVTYLDEDGAEATLEMRIGNRNLSETGRYVMLGDDPSIYLVETDLMDPLMRLSVFGLTQQ